MTTFAEDEASAEQNRPLELFLITHGTTIYRIASGNRDVLYGGFVYTALATARSEITVVDAHSGSPEEVSISLPVNHPLVVRYLLNGVPPGIINATITRIQQVSGQSQQMWAGQITSMGIDDMIAKFLIPARGQQATRRNLPTLTVDTLCGHVLYDKMCRAVQASFTISTTAISVSGNVIRVDMGATSTQNTWAQYGILKHVTSGEQMAVTSQSMLEPSGPSSVADLTLQFPIAELNTGDAIEVSAGCDHGIITCGDKFANQVNFGGLPQRPTTNIFTPGNFGIMEEA